MNKLLDIILPRYITEDVLFDFDPVLDAWVPVCSINDLQLGECYPLVGKIKSFNFFGIGFRPKLIGDLKPFEQHKRG